MHKQIKIKLVFLTFFLCHICLTDWFYTYFWNFGMYFFILGFSCFTSYIFSFILFFLRWVIILIALCSSPPVYLTIWTQIPIRPNMCWTWETLQKVLKLESSVWFDNMLAKDDVLAFDWSWSSCSCHGNILIFSFFPPSFPSLNLNINPLHHQPPCVSAPAPLPSQHLHFPPLLTSPSSPRRPSVCVEAWSHEALMTAWSTVAGLIQLAQLSRWAHSLCLTTSITFCCC